MAVSSSELAVTSTTHFHSATKPITACEYALAKWPETLFWLASSHLSSGSSAAGENATAVACPRRAAFLTARFVGGRSALDRWRDYCLLLYKAASRARRANLSGRLLHEGCRAAISERHGSATASHFLRDCYRACGGAILTAQHTANILYVPQRGRRAEAFGGLKAGSQLRHAAHRYFFPLGNSSLTFPARRCGSRSKHYSASSTSSGSDRQRYSGISTAHRQAPGAPRRPSSRRYSATAGVFQQEASSATVHASSSPSSPDRPVRSSSGISPEAGLLFPPAASIRLR